MPMTPTHSRAKCLQAAPLSGRGTLYGGSDIGETLVMIDQKPDI
jgi:hypothetical protein